MAARRSPRSGDPETALVTGASAGIGRELARIFAEHGYDLIVVARRKDELEELADACRREYRVRVHTLPMDLLVPDASKGWLSCWRTRTCVWTCWSTTPGSWRWGLSPRSASVSTSACCS